MVRNATVNDGSGLCRGPCITDRTPDAARRQSCRSASRPALGSKSYRLRVLLRHGKGISMPKPAVISRLRRPTGRPSLTSRRTHATASSSEPGGGGASGAVTGARPAVALAVVRGLAMLAVLDVARRVDVGWAVRGPAAEQLVKSNTASTQIGVTRFPRRSATICHSSWRTSTAAPYFPANSAGTAGDNRSRSLCSSGQLRATNKPL
jgi:hypothetical protein